MLKAELCDPSERFLKAIMIFSDKKIESQKNEIIQICKDKEKDIAYEKFINWTRQENEVAIFTTYAYADFSIPKEFDCIFNISNPEIYITNKFTLTQSIFEGWIPIDFIDHGHKHLCVLTFENQIPEILNQLHYETENYSTWVINTKEGLGICRLSDLQSITDAIKG
jgi:hypothetical protein